ncbi:MAG: helix-turn-helix domain-containing protein [Sphaerospermopsis kisseleviana]
MDCKISLNTIYALCNDQNKLPSEATLRKICESYQIQPGEILALVDVV